LSPITFDVEKDIDMKRRKHTEHPNPPSKIHLSA
jgi:hypothetical protein